MFFFTDDYILGRGSVSPIARFRLFFLRRKMRKTLYITKELYVISDEMKEAYRRLFGMEGYVVRNFSVEKISGCVDVVKDRDIKGLIMVYAGGLHYSRWKVLAQIAAELKRLNDSSKIKCRLMIYSAQKIADEIVECLSVEGASAFCGGASAAQIPGIYAGADMLLHVESFEKKAIASTKYSFSTKIPEYLSAEKCVFAVGPAEVASVRYLSGFACVVSENDSLSSTLTHLLNDASFRQSIKVNCIKKYEEDFSPKKQEECLARILSVS